MIAIIDYGAGNLRSVINAITRIGYQAEVTSQPEDILRAKAVFLPGWELPEILWIASKIGFNERPYINW